MEGLLKIFTFDKKRDLEKHCRGITIHRADLTLLVLTCKDGLMPFRHRIYGRDYVAPHLKPSEKEREALAIHDEDVAVNRQLGRYGAERTADYVTGPYRFEILAGVSHWVPETAADDLNRLLLEHLTTYD